MTEETVKTNLISTKELRKFRIPSGLEDEKFCDNTITTARYNA